MNMITKKWLEKGLYVVGVVIGLVMGIVLILFIFLWLNSPGKIEACTDENGQTLAGSVSEIVRRQIGEVEQGMIIKGKNEENPVLLFLHGGPGNPEYVMAKEENVDLEELFTVCWWEQRGSGMSYGGELPPITLAEMIADTVEVTEYLKERFKKDKIYLMGHSWGTFLGMKTIVAHPELYHAYIGIGQISDQMQSEQLAYNYLLEKLAGSKEQKKLKEVQPSQPVSFAELTPAYLSLRSELLSGLGNGVYHKPKSKLAMLLPILTAHEYTLSDIYGYAMGSLHSLESPANRSCYTTDLMDEVVDIKLPVYLFHGIHDKQVSYELAKEYYDLIIAPEKHFYSFENSAHSPFLEEPALFIDRIRKDVLDL